MARKLAALAFIALVSSTPGLATQSAAPDFTGTWTGTIRIPEKGKPADTTPLYAVFTHVGSELTGTIGPEPDGQLPISRGQVEATKFGTVITFNMAGPSFMMRFELRPAGGVLRGLARLDGEKAVAPVELQIDK